MSLSLPFFHAAPKIQPRHDPWPPTWRLPSGAIQVEATYKEPARQKLVDKSTRAVAFLALMVAVLGHNHWPFSEAGAWILQAVAADGPAALPELIAARAIVGLLAVVVIVGSYRLLLATLGLDRGTTKVLLDEDRIVIDGQSFDRRVTHGFDLDAHQLAKREDHCDRKQQIATPLYYRDSYTVTFQYGDRRIEVAEILGKRSAAKLVARLQWMREEPIAASQAHCTITQEQRRM